jgi:chloramphenicol 3-O phosphotransferase
VNGRVIVFNGGSSSGKTTLSRSVQSALGGLWLVTGVDQFLEMLPAHTFSDPDGFTIVDGVVQSGPSVKASFAGFQHSVAAFAHHGCDVIVDEVMLDGAADQHRWQQALAGLDVLWVGVRCAPDLAAAREQARGDRDPGMARVQAESVHRGVEYDIEVDTGELDAESAATQVAARIRELFTPPARSDRYHG